MIEKPIEWMGDSYDALCAFPVPAQRTPKKDIELARQRLRDVQRIRR